MMFKAFREERKRLMADLNAQLRNTLLGVRRKFSNDPCMCSECGRRYADPDSASICADWDSILGVDRHYWHENKPKSGQPR